MVQGRREGRRHGCPLLTPSVGAGTAWPLPQWEQGRTGFSSGWRLAAHPNPFLTPQVHLRSLSRMLIRPPSACARTSRERATWRPRARPQDERRRAGPHGRARPLAGYALVELAAAGVAAAGLPALAVAPRAGGAGEGF